MSRSDAPEARIDSGRLSGVWRGESAAFLGIPFAEAPVGPLRFEAPVPVASWDGVRPADRHGPTPLRRTSSLKTFVPEPFVPGDATLNVDVFTPAPGDERAGLPVVVYIHGGGYTGGSPASPWYDGRAFNRDGVVTVNVSYRLGFDGFGWIDGAPANRGVRDWLLALDWVQRNIGAFGGDPARVTIAGQSAGGGAVLALLAMPSARGLFSQVWSISGAPPDVSRERAQEIARRLAADAGVTPDRDGFASLDELRILDLQGKAGSETAGGKLAELRALLGTGTWSAPPVDGELIEAPTVEALEAGAGADIPLVIGSADDEITGILRGESKALHRVPPGLALAVLGARGARLRRDYLRANAGVRSQGTAMLLGRYATDMAFRANVLRIARARETVSAETWLYRFEWPSPISGFAQHCIDIPFFFDCLADEHVAEVIGDGAPQALADAVHGAAVAFSSAGDPGWPAWTGRPGTTRAFGGQNAVDPAGYASVAPLLEAR